MDSRLSGVLLLHDPLLRDLYAFYTEHHCCGELDGGVEEDRVWMTCTCGAVMCRRVDDV
jgi:hypothetical protein